MRTADVTCARDALQQFLGFETIVSLSVDGARILAALELDVVEHSRRATAGIGAITSTPLLHGLWLLPTGGSVPVAALPQNKVQLLRSASYAVRECGGSFVRTYSPPGVLRAVAFAGRCVERALLRATRFTPIVQRYVLVDDDDRSVPLRVECEAREWGVGVVALDEGDRAQQVVPASEAVVGIPSVYRWWIAELAYRRYLYDSTQPVN